MDGTSSPNFRELFTRSLVKISELKEQLELARGRNESVAVVGLACRFPGGADTPKKFWEMLDSGADAVVDIPKERWHSDHNLGSYCAGLLTDPQQFDADFFGIPQSEARVMDPQHRWLLEVGWEALESAGIAPRTAEQNHRTGVFLGVSAHDYEQLMLNDISRAHVPHVLTGNATTFAAGRLSRLLGLQGPSLAVDTACSSSLVALHLASQSLRAGDCDTALVAGANFITSPATMTALAATQTLSRSGRCHTFDARADGFVRGEGCGVLVLKRLSDAKKEGHKIWGVVRGSAVNHDGESLGLTTPNVLGQIALLQRALQNAEVNPQDVDMIEAHGTGTAFGDPIEFEALKTAYGAKREDESFCAVGSVKTNIGHLEAAAGVAGVIKVLLSMEHQRIPKHCNFKTLNPRISLAGSPFKIADQAMPWPRPQKIKLAGISGFGMSGTNAHVIIASHPEEDTRPQPAGPFQLRLSAQSESALAQTARQIREVIRAGTHRLDDLTHTLRIGRAPLSHSVELAAPDAKGLVAQLDQLIAGELKTSGPLPAAGTSPSHSALPLRRVPLPTYPWQHRRLWFDEEKSDSGHEERWFAVLSPERETTHRVIGLPFAGGGPPAFRDWPQHLPSHWETLGVSLPGRGSRVHEPLLRNVHTIIELLVPALERASLKPYVLVGHSMGALLAFEACKKLRQRGARLPNQLVTIGCPAPHLFQIDSSMIALSDDAFIDAVRKQYEGIVPAEVVKDPELRQLFLPILRADLAAVTAYEFVVSEPLPIPITAVAGRNDALAPLEALKEWSRHTTASFSTHQIEGGHFFASTEVPKLTRLVVNGTD